MVEGWEDCTWRETVNGDRPSNGNQETWVCLPGKGEVSSKCRVEAYYALKHYVHLHVCRGHKSAPFLGVKQLQKESRDLDDTATNKKIAADMAGAGLLGGM